MRALGYIRVSTEEQGRAGHSMDMQPTRIRQWCDLRAGLAGEGGLELVDIIRDEGISAGTPLERRKGGAQLLQRLQAGEADVVVVYKLDRLFRDTLDGLLFFRQFAEPRGLVVQSVSELIDTSTPQGRLNLNLQLSLAEYERGVTCERNTAVSNHLRATGRTFGPTPYGCREIDGRLYRDPATWTQREAVVAAAQALVNGKRPSLQQIVDALHQSGIPSPQGRARWDKSSVSRVIKTHDGIKHYPAAPSGHEAQVSGEVMA